MSCERCGYPATGSRCENCGNLMLAVADTQTGNAFSWPFQQRHPYASLWMPLLWWLLPPFSGLISLGWSVEAIRRKGRQNTTRLPPTSNLASILKDGLVVTVMIVLYFVIPLAILAKLVEWSWLEQLRELIVLLWRTLVHQPHEGLVSFLWKKIFEALIDATTPIIYLVIATPMFFAARLRYALTGKVRSFFNLFGNLVVCFRHVGGILLYLFLATVINVAIVLLSGLVAGTIIGLILPLFLGAASIWIFADLAGSIASAMYLADGIGQFNRASATPVVAVAHSISSFALPSAEPAMLPVAFVAPRLLGVVPTLYCRTGPLSGDLFPVPQEGLYIGRSPQLAHLIVDQPEVSARHVHITLDQDAGGIWIEDINSRNGTFCCLGANSWQPVRGRQHLAAGDRFRLSRNAAEFELREQ